MKFNKLGLLGAACALTLLGNTPALADTAIVTVSATVVGTCKFNSGGSVGFTLDPSVGGLVNGAITQPKFWCTKGTAYTLTDDNGKYESGTVHRMTDDATGTEFIPYTFTYTTTGNGTGPGLPITLDIVSQVAANDYLNKPAGTYADTVTLTITP